MTAQEIITLLQGGFTHDEIMALVQTPAAPAPVPVPAPAQDPQPAAQPIEQPAPAPVPAPAPASQPEPAPAPAPAPAPDPEQPDMMKLFQGMMAAQTEMQRQMATLTGAIQANAIASSQIPGGGMPNPPDAASVLAEIIRPSRKEVK